MQKTFLKKLYYPCVEAHMTTETELTASVPIIMKWSAFHTLENPTHKNWEYSVMLFITVLQYCEKNYDTFFEKLLISFTYLLYIENNHGLKRVYMYLAASITKLFYPKVIVYSWIEPILNSR